MDNLLEFTLGGDPLIDDAASALPVFQPLQNHAYYIYNERTGDPSLAYTVQRSTNLVSNVWKTNDVEWVGETGMANSFKAVTNRTDIGAVEFMRLNVEEE